MNREQIIRAWRNEEYRSTLSEAERASLPDHPAGVLQLSEAEMGGVAARDTPFQYTTILATMDFVCWVTMVNCEG